MSSGGAMSGKKKKAGQTTTTATTTPTTTGKSTTTSTAAAAVGPDERRSGRLRTKVRVRSVIDPETRRLVQAQRLAALEMDNYEEPSLAELASGDGAYVNEEEEEEVAQGGGKQSKKRKGRSTSTTGSAGGPKERGAKALASSYRVRNFDHVVAESEYDDESVNYKTIAAPESSKPARHFCSVCGFFGGYTCTRCGLRFCGLRCQQTHKETRCLKFSE